MCLTRICPVAFYSELRQSNIDSKTNKKKDKKTGNKSVQTTNSMDLHAWVENSNGEVIFDPMFNEYKEKLDKWDAYECFDDDGDRAYDEVYCELEGPEYSRIKDKIMDIMVYPTIIVNVNNLKKQGMKGTDQEIMEKFLTHTAENPSFAACFLNAHAWIVANRDRLGDDYRYCLGKLGFRYNKPYSGWKKETDFHNNVRKINKGHPDCGCEQGIKWLYG